MISKDQLRGLPHARVIDTSGSEVGSVGQIYLHDHTGEPAWITVNTGLFGTSESFVPLEEANLQGEDIAIPYDKDRVSAAPRIDADQHLDAEHERELYRYYGLAVDDEGQDADRTDASQGRPDPGYSNAESGVDTTAGYPGHPAGRTERGYADTSGAGTAPVRPDPGYSNAESGVDTSAGYPGNGPGAEDEGGAMTRHEERLRVGTQSETTGRVRLRKYVVTEMETVTVPVRREEIRVEHVPFDEPRVVEQGEASFVEEEQEIVLHQERPVVSTETVETERVRLDKHVVQEQEHVTGEVRHEEIELDDGSGTTEGPEGLDTRRTDDERGPDHPR